MPNPQFPDDLARVIAPEVKALGFAGSFPDFYRERPNHIELLAFRFIQSEPLLPGEQTIFSLKIVASFVGPGSENVSPYSLDATALQPHELHTEHTRSMFELCFPGDSSGLPNFLRYDEHTEAETIAPIIVEGIKTQADQWWGKKREVVV